MSIESWALLATLGGLAVSAATLILGVLGYRNVKQNHLDAIKPYVVLSYRIDGAASSTQAVYLDISNHGQTPANSVILRFGTTPAWNDVNHRNFPFLVENGGITTLAPRETRSFFVGRLTSESKLQNLRLLDNEVEISFLGLHDQRPMRSIDQIGFRDFAGAKKLVADKRQMPATTRRASKTTTKKTGAK